MQLKVSSRKGGKISFAVENPKKMNSNRRRFLKFILVGVGILIARGLLGGSFFQFSEKIKREDILGDFKLVETNEGIVFIDRKTGEKTLVIEK